MLTKNLIQFYRIIRGKSPYIKISTKKEHRWMGSKNGGFYLHPHSINENSIVYSIGIGEDISFDQAIIDTFGCKVYGFDPTPKSIEWVKNNVSNNNFIFEPVGIGVETGTSTFYLPKNEQHVSGSLSHNDVTDKSQAIEVKIKRFIDMARAHNHHTIDVLKMDIEGSEYDVMPDILDSDIKINQILIEVHHRLIPNGNAKTKNLIKLMNQNGYKVFAVSDLAEEISFIRQ
ncbi:MAG: FkbM family methyltransferase [Carboxylicivirga sp.]|nr:FkbM family methyltransferase [Carboxylicivirga sp.]